MRREHVSLEVKRQVVARAHELCESCLSPLALSTSPFEIEHIIPVAQSGTSNADNLALACGGCNGFKGERTLAIDPVTGVHVRLYHPRQHQWSDHFVWSSDFTYLTGVSAIGRAMVAALHLNRDGVLTRKSLIRDSEHPPIF